MTANGDIPPRQVVNSFSIVRRLGIQSREVDLAFIDKIPAIARAEGVGINIELGNTAIDLVRRGEIWGIRQSAPQLGERLTEEKVREGIKQAGYASTRKRRQLVTYALNSADIFFTKHELPAIGMSIGPFGQIDSENERQEMAGIMSAVSGTEITLGSTIHFVKICEITSNRNQADRIIDYVDENMPNNVDLYFPDTQRSDLILPN